MSYVTVTQTRTGFLPVLNKYLDDGEYVAVPGMYDVLDRSFAVTMARSWASAIGVPCRAS